MATKRIQLAVDTPCQQQWQDMKSVDTGRFCDRCHDWLYNDRNTSTPDHSEPLSIKLAEDQTLLGEVIVAGGYKKTSFFQRLRNRLRSSH